jgi:protein-L-isoaspartate O-methyltransferase
MSSTQFAYVGTELELFARAVHWKRYVADLLAPHISGRVLEVGAGIGSNTGYLADVSTFTSWECLEPDRSQADVIREKIAAGQMPADCTVTVGTLADAPPDARYDAILYLDVLEHIRDDGAEVALAAAHLARNGRLIVLAPAHNWLFTPFDERIGHFRRYSRRSLAALTVPGLRIRSLRYADSVGMMASLANRLLLSASMPTDRQIQVWDQCMVPISRVSDRLLMGSLGKSVIAVWERDTAG